MGKLSGWQKLGLVAGVGCVSIVLILVVGTAAAVFWARSTMAELGDTTPTDVEKTVALAPQTAEATPERGPDAPPAAGGGVSDVRLDLEEGRFTIEPGERGGQLQVSGRFSPSLYELTEDQQTGPDGQRRAIVRFRSKAPFWARMLSGLGDSGQPRLTIRIPEAVPMDLDLRIAMGESRVDLGRLTVRDLNLDLSMGEHRIDFGAPVVEGLRRLQLTTRMGEVRLANIGNARPQRLEANGSMGNITADLGGAWESGSTPELTFTQSMGELRLNVPDDVRLDADVRDANQTATPRDTSESETAGPEAPILKLRVSSSMGNTRINRYSR